MTKGDAREAVAKIVAEIRARQETPRKFGEFVEAVYFPYYSRKWKHSTQENNVSRIEVHLVEAYREQKLGSFKRDELQDLLDAKAKDLSFLMVDHLRWDLKQIFDMALAEGHIDRNPAVLLFTPKEAKRPVRRAMTIEEVQTMFAALAERERLIAKLAVLAGMRPGEIYALTWGRMASTHADIRQRVYRRKLDTPKTTNSCRKAALSEGLLNDIEAWRAAAVSTADHAGVFPSEWMTPLSKDNFWRREMLPKLAAVGLGWANFLVMRRTHSTLMKEIGVDAKLVADQLGHEVDVDINTNTLTSVELRQAAVNQLESFVGAKQCSNGAQEIGYARK
ncbi:MAG: tyrosine-type recombinase/integrase [Terriglobia bacterium]|jgi:integrase